MRAQGEALGTTHGTRPDLSKGETILSPLQGRSALEAELLSAKSRFPMTTQGSNPGAGCRDRLTGDTTERRQTREPTPAGVATGCLALSGLAAFRRGPRAAPWATMFAPLGLAARLSLETSIYIRSLGYPVSPLRRAASFPIEGSIHIRIKVGARDSDRVYRGQFFRFLLDFHRSGGYRP